MSIAWDFLSDLQIAQLLYFRPDLREEYEQWKKGTEDEIQKTNDYTYPTTHKLKVAY